MADVRLTARQAAALVGVAYSTWRAYVSRGQAPGPDGHEELSGMQWYWRSTIQAWNDSRPGQGRRAS